MLWAPIIDCGMTRVIVKLPVTSVATVLFSTPSYFIEVDELAANPFPVTVTDVPTGPEL